MSHWIDILGVALGGLLLLVFYSMLAMAQKGDEFSDLLEMEQLRAREYALPVSKGGEPANSVLWAPLICITVAPPKL
jgi:hypothetical protein